FVAWQSRFSEFCLDGGIGLVFPAAPASSGQQDRVAFYLNIHRWIAEGEELMPRSDPRKARLLPGSHPLEEGLHGLIQSEVDLRQQLAIDLLDAGVKLPALG